MDARDNETLKLHINTTYTVTTGVCVCVCVCGAPARCSRAPTTTPPSPPPLLRHLGSHDLRLLTQDPKLNRTSRAGLPSGTTAFVRQRHTAKSKAIMYHTVCNPFTLKCSQSVCCMRQHPKCFVRSE